MTDRLLSFVDLGGRWSKAPRTAQRIAEAVGLPLFRIGGSWRVKLSDVEIYEDCIKRPAEPSGLKGLVAQAVNRARARRTS